MHLRSFTSPPPFSTCSLHPYKQNPSSLPLMEFSTVLIRLSVVFLLLALFTTAEPLPVLDSQSAGNQGVEVSPPTAGIDCGAACGVRCGQSSRPNLCRRACRTCCARCSCVPPGTYGNYEACTCYGAITTRGGRRKCP